MSAIHLGKNVIFYVLLGQAHIAKVSLYMHTLKRQTNIFGEDTIKNLADISTNVVIQEKLKLCLALVEVRKAKVGVNYITTTDCEEYC